MGLSPRVRGNHRGSGWSCVANGSIPACAGEPHRRPGSEGTTGVYPRVCGGTHGAVSMRSHSAGLSPLVRGNHGRELLALALDRSIPACAGEPRPVDWPRPYSWVYPRVCGGTTTDRLDALILAGLSPRVRGNQEQRGGRGAGRGSIPACAGEPSATRRGRHDKAVYPRVCGGTGASVAIQQSIVGLSPRVRGNLSPGLCGPRGARSIPACAGEP